MVCIETLEVIVKMYQTINRFSICDFLEALRKKHSDLNRKIYFICDNAGYCFANDTKKKTKELNIKLVFFPSYSPNLNLIERPWKFMKKKVFLEYHETSNDFKIAAKKFFQYIRKYKKDLDTLLTKDFQLLDSSFAD